MLTGDMLRAVSRAESGAETTGRRSSRDAITIRDMAPAVPPALGRPSVTVDGSTRPASRLPRGSPGLPTPPAPTENNQGTFLRPDLSPGVPSHNAAM